MQDVIIKIQTDDKDLDSTINKLVKMGKVDDANAKSFTKNQDKYKNGYKQQEGLIEKLERREKKFIELRRKANNPKTIQHYNKLIDLQRKKLGQLTGATKKQANQMGAMSKMAMNLGGALSAAFVVKEIFEFGKELRELSISMELGAKKAAIVFGDELVVVEQRAREVANSLGLTNNEFVDAAAATQDLLVPMKFTREESAKMSTQMVELSGALSEWSAGKFEATEVSEILTKAMLGETEQMKSLGIKIDQTSKAFNNRVKALMESEGMTLEQAKATEILNQIMDKSTDAQDEFANGQVSIARKSAMNNATLREQKEILATELTPVWGVLEDVWSDAITEGQKKLLDFSKGITAIRDSFKGWLKDIKGGITALTGYEFAEEKVIEVEKKHLVSIKDLMKGQKEGAVAGIKVQKELTDKQKKEYANQLKDRQKAIADKLKLEDELRKMIAKASEDDEKELTDISEAAAKRMKEIKEEIRATEIELMRDDFEKRKALLQEQFEAETDTLDENIAEEHELKLLKKKELEEKITEIEGDEEKKRVAIAKQADAEKLQLISSYVNNVAQAATQLTDFVNKQASREVNWKMQEIDRQLENGEISAEEADKKRRKLMNLRAKQEKDAALISATIATAQAVAAALTAGPGVGQALAIITAALGAAEIAIISSTPVPEYALGTKGTSEDSGAIVGERGREAVFLPQGSKVLPNRQTVQHGDLIDAMYDNNLDGFLLQSYIPKKFPKLMSKSDIDNRFINNFTQNLGKEGFSDDAIVKTLKKTSEKEFSAMMFLADAILKTNNSRVNLRR